MTIPYRLVHFRHPRTGEKFARPVVFNRERADGRAFVRTACEKTTIGMGDALGTLAVLADQLAFDLRHGRRVHIPDLGLFHIVLLYEPADPAKFDQRKHIRGVRVRFRPDAALVQRLKTAHYSLEQRHPARRRKAGRQKQ